MTSIKDVAELAGVSIATVSRFVNSPASVRAPTAKRVADAIKQTGYETNSLARNFRTGKTQQIMVVLPSIGIPFYGPIVDGVRKVASAAGYHILVMETAYHSVEYDDFNRMVMSKQTDGIILLSTLSPFSEPNLSQRATHPPIVLGLESISSELSVFPSVCIDNKRAAQDAVNYLISLGHKKIGFFNGYIGLTYGTKIVQTGLRDRAEGFSTALREHKLLEKAEWNISARMSATGGRQAAQQLLALPQRPTAIFCSNDEMALGAMYELKNAGLKIPNDISIIGLDNMSYSEISDPPLTTIEQPTKRIGERSMKRLLNLIAGKKARKNIEILPHQLVERASCAPPRKKK